MLQRLLDHLPGRTDSDTRRLRSLAALHRKALRATAHGNPALWREMAELCLANGDTARALGYFGRGIDALLIDGEYDAAAALCRQVIRQVPEVVRARCTLAFLYLRYGASADFRLALLGYVDAARHAGAEEIAATRLHMMVAATDDEGVRKLIREQLELLERYAVSAYVSRRPAAREGREPFMDAGSQDERWARMLRLVITDQLAGEASATDGPAAEPVPRTAPIR